MTNPTEPGPLRRAGWVGRVVLAALLSAAVLSACNPDQLGAAAIVDGTVVSTSDLQADTRAYLALVPDGDKSQVQQRILERIVISRVIRNLARRQGLHVSTGTVADQRDEILASTKGRTALVRQLAAQQTPTVLPPSLIDLWVHDQLLYRKILTKLGGGDPTSNTAAARGTKALVAESQRMKIEINPRYGTWNPRRGIEAQLSGGLAKTSAQLAART